MNIPVETANAAMNLVGGALALVAAIIAAVAAMLPRESAVAAIEKIRAKAVSFFAAASAVAASAAVIIFDSPRFGLFFIFICASLTSVIYLRSKHPATRAETFVLVIQIALVLAFALLYWVARIVTVLERHA